MKLKIPINLHKGATFLVVLSLMTWFGNFSPGPFIYLAMHGSYGLLWLLKDRVYPDKQWDQNISLPYAILVFVSLGLYWIPAFVITSSGLLPPPVILSVALAMYAFGLVLHFASDAQKYYTLKYQAGLITEGFFSRCRNTNYLGEAMIYLSFALLAWHPVAFTGILMFFIFVFLPNMMRKDKSLERYPGFQEYRKKSGFFFPSLRG